jgi:quinol-cytochrome oxidoreductase complex cytochrome b subunit
MNNLKYYEDNLSKSADLKNQYIVNKSEWYRSLVFVATTVFGILVAFYNNNNQTLSHLYILAIALLALSILSGIFVSYQSLFYQSKTSKRFEESIRTALESNQKIEPVFEGKRVIFSLSEFVCVFSFCLSVILFLVQILIGSI